LNNDSKRQIKQKRLNSIAIPSLCLYEMNRASPPGNSAMFRRGIEEKPPNRPAFHYKPLDPSVDCIRLLALLPYDERRPDIVRCKLFTVRFSEKPEYEALSYTWGESKPAETILLNGEPFAIQENLYNALDNLRPTGDRPRMLWADAICIDQGNLEERKRQVGLMDYIYTRASTVLIWLGRGTAEVQKIFAKKFMDLEQFYHTQEQKEEQAKWRQWVYQRTSWTRLWVIQEIGLSKNLRVCIGRFSKHWDKFLVCLNENGNNKHKYEDDLIRKLDQKRKGRHGKDNRLEKLLEDFQYARCKDQRDKVYGLLGLAYDCQDGSIEPDYTKPLFGLYTDLLTW